MDYNSFSNGELGHQQQQAGDSSNVDDRRDGMFGWMASQPDLPPESLPSAPEPMIYEGFIPHEYPGLYQPATAFPVDDPDTFQPNSLPILHRSVLDNGDDDDRPAVSSMDSDGFSRMPSTGGTKTALGPIQIGTDEANAQGTPKRRRGRPPGKSNAKPNKPKKSKKGEGKRGGWCKGMKLGPRPVVDASPAFNKLYAEAVECIIAEPPNPQRALELITRAIALNPEQHRAHPVLAEAHHKLGNDQAAIDILFVGAHANPRDPEAWQDVAQRCQDWTGIGRKAALEKALIAYSELINIDRNNHEARFKRAAIFREQGRVPKAINELEKVLRALPYNSSAMEEYAKACIDLQQVQRAIDLYKEAIEHHMDIGLGNSDDHFEWSGVGVYADLVARNGKPTETIPMAIRALKTLSRWLQGRQIETYWERESLKDDAEFDLADEPRRICVAEYMPAKRLPEAYGLGFPLELRAQLGILRLRNGDRLEALGHFELLMEPMQDEGHGYVHQISDLFLQVAKALADTKEHREALRFYEALWEAEAVDSHDFWIGIGHSSYVCNKRERALECFQNAIACDNESVEAKTWIGKILIEKGDKFEAIEYLTQAVEIGQAKITYKPDTRVYEKKEPRLLREEAERTLKHAHTLIGPKVKKKYNKRKRPDPQSEQDGLNISEGTPQNVDTPGTDEPETPGRPTAKRRDNRDQRGPRPLRVQLLPDEDEDLRHERILQYYTTLLNNTEAMRSGDAIARGIWIDCATSLIDDFRSTKVLFAKDRQQGLTPNLIAAINRIQSTPGKKRRNSESPSQTPTIETPVPLTTSDNTILATTYRSIPFTAWLDIILEYSLLLTHPPPHSPPSTPPNPSHKRPCYDTINLALSCIIFSSNPGFTFQIQICHLICAVAFRDQKNLFNNVLRWFMREHAFCTDAYRLFGAMNLYFPYFTPVTGLGGKEGVISRAVWRSTNTAKALRRHVYAIDKSLVDDYVDPTEGPVPAFMREERHETFTAFEEPQPYTDPTGTGITTTQKTVLRPEEMDVVLLTLYGQILYATGSFVSALSYFYRARAIDPDNPLVLLSIALSYMHQMLKKGEESSGSRHGLVLQGWAMLGEYEDKRLAWAERKEEEAGLERGVIVEEIKREIAWNRGRCWEMIGCAGLAKQEYEKLLVREQDVLDPMLVGGHEDGDSMKEKEKEKDYDGKWTMEAAYAVSNMYLMGGDPQSARIVAEKYLVVE